VETVDVIVAGAGIIGLTTALELAQNGFRVRVLERGRAMGEASWAAAGMLSPDDPEHPTELRPLAALSFRLYPEYLRLVEQFSGRQVPLRTQAAVVASEMGSELHSNQTLCHSLSAGEAERRIPGLATDGRSFCWIEEPSLDPRDLCAALPPAAEAAGVEVRQETEVLEVIERDGAVEVRTPRETMRAGAFVNCCGAWAAGVRVSGQQPSAAAVEPRKGQMIAVRMAPPLDLAYVLRSPEIYLVPRGRGLIVIGATVERAGFDRQVEPAVVERLQGLAAKLWPAIASAPVVESWSGIRPGTRDELPLIGSGGTPHCWIATGHFRNGILLAPATGMVVRQLLQGKAPEVSVADFLPGRQRACSG
jgi:glycine oxidase